MTASAPASSAAPCSTSSATRWRCTATPEHIPEQFTADLGPLDFNDNVRWHDLKGTENVKSVIDRDFVVATVVPPTKIEVVAESGRRPARPALPPRRPKGGDEGAGKAPAKK